jgi:hypothetical protein
LVRKPGIDEIAECDLTTKNRLSPRLATGIAEWAGINDPSSFGNVSQTEALLAMPNVRVLYINESK